MSKLSSGFLGAQASADAGDAFNNALQELKEKYEKIEEDKQRAAAKEAEKQYAEEHKDDGPDLDDPELDKIREARLKAIKEAAEQKQQHLALGHGDYREIVEDEFLTEVTQSKNVVCHFYHRDFERCKIMDHHLRIICKKFIGTKFVHINAEKAKFFVEKLQIRVLPTLVFFQDGVTKKRQTGFDGLGGDEFRTKALILKLKSVGMLGKAAEDVGSESDTDDEGDTTRRALSDIREGATLAEAREIMRQKIMNGGFSDDDFSDLDSDADD